MQRRRLLAGVVGATALTAGCAGTGLTDGPDGTPTGSGGDCPTGTDARTDTFDPDHAVRVENRDDTGRTLSITVTGDGVVFEETVTVAPDERTVIYNTRRADPEGIVTYGITAESDGETGRVDVRTDCCHGDIGFDVRPGRLLVSKEVC